MTELSRFMKKEVQDFLFSHGEEAAEKFILSGKRVGGLSPVELATQMKGRQKAKDRFPMLYQTRGIIYPPSQNLEQCSSEATARFKSTLISGKTGADLTMGFGIDTLFMSAHCTLTAVEPDESLLHIARHNHGLLGARSINYVNNTAEQFLGQTPPDFDFIYLDPSRRKGSRKVFRFADCSPNVPALLSALLAKAPQILLKASPMHDIRQGIIELNHLVTGVWVVAVDNECKELLFLIAREPSPNPVIHAVDLDTDGRIKSSVQFTHEEERNASPAYGAPQTFLYEPNAAVMKAGAFHWIARHYELIKLAPDSHFYTSEKIVADFPGKRFRILGTAKLNKQLQQLFPDGRANVISRNYPLTPDEIRKKTGLKEGGNDYLICSSTRTEKIALIARRE